MLEVRNMSVNLGGADVVQDVSFEVAAGENIAIIGPNGCGKSTLLRSMVGSVPPISGDILFCGQKFTGLRSRQRAKSMGLLSQQESVPSMTTVFDHVCAGRHPYRNFFRGLNQFDIQFVHQILIDFDIDHLRKNLVERLSGGERQRVRLATLMAQDPQIVLLDEPMTGLDLCHQYSLLNLILEAKRASNKAVVSVVHDIDMALRFFSRLLVMNGGKIVADGVPHEVLTDSLIHEVFGVCGTIQTVPQTSFPLFICDPLQCRNHGVESELCSFASSESIV